MIHVSLLVSHHWHSYWSSFNMSRFSNTVTEPSSQRGSDKPSAAKQLFLT